MRHSPDVHPEGLQEQKTYLEICALLGNYADYWPLKMGPIGCPEKLAKNYHYILSNFPEERRFHLLRGGSLKLRKRYISATMRSLTQETTRLGIQFMNHFVVNNIVIQNLFSSTYDVERNSKALNGGFGAGLKVSRSMV